MASKKKDQLPSKMNGVINKAGEIVEEKIVNTLEKNYMPYAMSVIMSRAIPEIDGFKPAHRKLLYTMHKMGLLGAQRTKSANIVGQTMKLNPHGDSAIYDTMVRLSRGYEALLHPYIDSKGNFGKSYSRDMACAASRYTEAKLDNIARELFCDIDKDTVDFIDNYDNTMKEPMLLPARFPSVLVNANTGIAVGMASSICPFNLKEVCATTIHLMDNPKHNISSTLIAPDFPGGGQLIYDRETIDEIYSNGRGSVKIRSRYNYDKTENCIDITSIPPTTSAEAIIEKIIDLVKSGKVREVSDVRDETGIDGLKITIDLKRGINYEKLMQKLYKMTPLEDSFSCNFNILISGAPRVMGVREILNEWIAFRVGCVRRKTRFDLEKKKLKLHLLYGLRSIMLDIDKAIAIIRQTQEDSAVVPNIMKGFRIDSVQAEFVVEIKLRNLNREYILRRTDEITSIEKDIRELEGLLASDESIKKLIAKELKEISEKYGKPRKTLLVYPKDIGVYDAENEVVGYPVHLFLTEHGYFKKITSQSLRMNADQKLKEEDTIIQLTEATNDCDLLLFTNKHQVYKTKVYDFQDSKASVLGDFLPTKMSLDSDERVLYLVATKDYAGYMLFFFCNGAIAKVGMNEYMTKTNRKKLIKAYSDKVSLLEIMHVKQDISCLMGSTSGRKLLVYTGDIAAKSTKSTQGLTVMTQLKGHKLAYVKAQIDLLPSEQEYYRANKIPSSGKSPLTNTTSQTASEQQLNFFT